jgi:hypothetical protein
VCAREGVDRSGLGGGVGGSRGRGGSGERGRGMGGGEDMGVSGGREEMGVSGRWGLGEGNDVAEGPDVKNQLRRTTRPLFCMLTIFRMSEIKVAK